MLWLERTFQFCTWLWSYRITRNVTGAAYSYWCFVLKPALQLITIVYLLRVLLHAINVKCYSVTGIKCGSYMSAAWIFKYQKYRGVFSSEWTMWHDTCNPEANKMCHTSIKWKRCTSMIYQHSFCMLVSASAGFATSPPRLCHWTSLGDSHPRPSVTEYQKTSLYIKEQ